jgi:hypothetical protein
VTNCFQILSLYCLWPNPLFITHYITSADERICWTSISINQLVKNLIGRNCSVPIYWNRTTVLCADFMMYPNIWAPAYGGIYVNKTEVHVFWILVSDGSENTSSTLVTVCLESSSLDDLLMTGCIMEAAWMQWKTEISLHLTGIHPWLLVHNHNFSLRSGIFMVVTMKNGVFWEVTKYFFVGCISC